jgi:hypothetical protein
MLSTRNACQLIEDFAQHGFQSLWARLHLFTQLEPTTEAHSMWSQGPRHSKDGAQRFHGIKRTITSGEYEKKDIQNSLTDLKKSLYLPLRRMLLSEKHVSMILLPLVTGVVQCTKVRAMNPNASPGRMGMRRSRPF